MIEWIKNLRSTDRGKALFKLMLYGVFFIIVFVILFLGGAMNRMKGRTNSTIEKESSSIESREESTKEMTYFDKQNKLLNENYKFQYFIKGKIEANFEGEVKDNIVNGYKETAEELIKYSIEDGVVYKIGLKDKEEYHSLYEGLDEHLFDFRNLFSTLNQASSTIERQNNKKTYTYKDILGYNIDITTGETSIEKITIKNEQLEYNFEFSY